MTAPCSVEWASGPADREAVAAFLARVVAMDTAYISHGEVQLALSLDGKTWAPDLAERLRLELSGTDASFSVCVARDEGGAIVGAAVVQWDLDGPMPFAVLADMAVEPASRSAGVGLSMVKAIDAETRRRGARWIFLESGVRNARAHAFFESAGFTVMSKTFAKQIGD